MYSQALILRAGDTRKKKVVAEGVHARALTMGGSLQPSRCLKPLLLLLHRYRSLGRLLNTPAVYIV